jgi:hypothetical protein
VPPIYTHTAADARTYYLHGKTVVLPGGRRQPVYWFARRATPGAVLAAVPAGYRVAESPRTRRPYLRKA